MNPMRNAMTGIALLTLGAGLASAQSLCPGQRLTPSNPGAFTDFGFSTAIWGDTAVVGRRSVLPSAIGSAYIFSHSAATGWVQVQQIVPPDGEAGDSFGDALAIEGDVIAIGARSHDHEGLKAGGAVYMFRRTEGAPAEAAGGWVFEQEILPPEGGANFGRLVEIDDDRVLATMSGAVQLFHYDGTSWTLQHMLSGPAGDCYGCAVSLDGDVLVIGAQGDDTFCPPDPDPKAGAVNSGIVFVYRFNGEQWALEQSLSPSDADCQRRFGTSVAVSGDTIIATASVNPPAAYIFDYDRSAGQWVESAVFTHPPGFGGTMFGATPRSTAIDGDLAIVGARFSDYGFPDAGAAFVYQRAPGGPFELLEVLLPQPNPWSNWFGRSVWLDNGRAIVGADGEDQGSGAAYIFDLQPPAGDINCDGVINGLDLGNLLANWSIPPDAPACAGDTPCAADINSDGVVDGLDLGILLANWTIP